MTKYEDIINSEFVKIITIKEIILKELNIASYDKLKSNINNIILDNSYVDDIYLNYYKKYIGILKEKLNELLKIIDDLEKIEDGTYNFSNKLEIINYLYKYDILINQNKLLSKKDAIRLIVPIVYNYNILIAKIDEYYNNDFKHVNLDIYPDINLQNKNNNSDEYIPLSEIQKRLIKLKEDN